VPPRAPSRREAELVGVEDSKTRTSDDLAPNQGGCRYPILRCGLATGGGVEPPSAESESAVLPLNYPAPFLPGLLPGLTGCAPCGPAWLAATFLESIYRYRAVGPRVAFCSRLFPVASATESLALRQLARIACLQGRRLPVGRRAHEGYFVCVMRDLFSFHRTGTGASN
jgi:hypothetical protein